LGERLLCKQEVIGSIPFTSTNKPRAASAGLHGSGEATISPALDRVGRFFDK
jgi:hypothetical protein